LLKGKLRASAFCNNLFEGGFMKAVLGEGRSLEAGFSDLYKRAGRLATRYHVLEALEARNLANDHGAQARCGTVVLSVVTETIALGLAVRDIQARSPHSPEAAENAANLWGYYDMVRAAQKIGYGVESVVVPHSAAAPQPG
jgi:hypothetical protein